ncbi:SHOCT domain-containing protein [Bacillus sp. REN3]|uniref:SHOCT domain-containing protein n=1 Tax=Bacillus sp. REN3 TaxID=2802440 RepID=UPI001AEE39F6|nr:SHOCT domain-containing protein [Bacillus sp. REN3]
MGVGIGCLGMIFFAIILFTGISDDSGSGFVWFCIIGIFASAFVGLYLDNKRKINFVVDLSKNMKNIVENIKDFNISQEFMSPNRESYIAIDEDTKKVCIIENKHKNHGELSPTLSKFEYESFIYSFSEIIQSEIIKDGVTINKTSRGSQIGGAIVGGIVAGGVGAVIGGLGASSESKTTTTQLELQLVVNNSKKSSHKIVFMSPHDIGKVITGDEISEINHWHNLFTHILNRNNDSKLGKVEKNQQPIAEELQKLAQLKMSGFLTDDEFEIQKQKLLSS